jgi:hypothetical protein
MSRRVTTSRHRHKVTIDNADVSDGNACTKPKVCFIPLIIFSSRQLEKDNKRTTAVRGGYIYVE